MPSQFHRRWISRDGLAEIDEWSVGGKGSAQHPALGLADGRGFDGGQPGIGDRPGTRCRGVRHSISHSFYGRSIPVQLDPVKPELRPCVHWKMHCLGLPLCIASAARLPGESQSTNGQSEGRLLGGTVWFRVRLVVVVLWPARLRCRPQWSRHPSCVAPMPRASSRSGCGTTGCPAPTCATEKIIRDWAEKAKVDVTIDFITSQGNKLLLTTAAEAQAGSGHDILAMNTFLPARYSEQLVPVNDEMEQAHRRQRQGQRHCRVSRQAQRQVAGHSGHHRQPDQGSVLAHRSPEEACRHRHPGDVSGRRTAQGG